MYMYMYIYIYIYMYIYIHVSAKAPVAARRSLSGWWGRRLRRRARAPVSDVELRQLSQGDNKVIHKATGVPRS